MGTERVGQAQVEMRAIDIKPNRWALLCTFRGSDRVIENPIGPRRWSEDGESIWFMLDSHNTFNARPDELVSVVPHLGYASPEALAQSDARDEEVMGRRTSMCPCCGSHPVQIGAEKGGAPQGGGTDHG